MKIEFENSIRRLSYLSHLPDIKIAWMNPCHLNFVNVQGILAQGIYDVHAIFHQFSDVKNGVQSQQPSILRQLVFGEPQCTEISHPEES